MASGYLGSIDPATDIKLYIWMWGLVALSLTGSHGMQFLSAEFLTTDIHELFLPSLIFFIFILVILFIIVKIILNERNGECKSFVQLLYGTILIVSSIIYYFIFDISMRMWYERTSGASLSHSAWDEFDPGFGIIGLILSGIILIIGSAYSKYFEKQNKYVKKLRAQRIKIVSSPNHASNKVLTPASKAINNSGNQTNNSIYLNDAPHICPRCGKEHQNQGLYCKKCEMKR